MGFEVIEECKLTYYNPNLQKMKYFAPSAIYHMYKNNIHTNLKYIGFMEYDLVLTSPGIKSVTEYIKKSIENDMVILLSCRHTYKTLYDCDIKINNEHHMLIIINDYNNFLGLIISILIFIMKIL